MKFSSTKLLKKRNSCDCRTKFSEIVNYLKKNNYIILSEYRDKSKRFNARNDSKSLRGGNSDTGFSPIPMLTYGEILPNVYSLHNSFH